MMAGWLMVTVMSGPEARVVAGDSDRHRPAGVVDLAAEHRARVFDSRVRCVEDLRDLRIRAGESILDRSREHEADPHDRKDEEREDGKKEGRASLLVALTKSKTVHRSYSSLMASVSAPAD